MSPHAELRDRLPEALRLVMVTAGRGEATAIEAAVRRAIDSGLRAVHVREPDLGARELAALCIRLRTLLDAVDGLVVVGDRADVAASGAAHAVQLGHRSLDPASVRRFVGEGVLIGCSTHDADELHAAAGGGADFATLAPVFPTRSKAGHPGLGVEAARGLTLSSPLPVVWLGGFDPQRIRSCAGEPAVGFAALGAFEDADVGAALCDAARSREVER